MIKLDYIASGYAVNPSDRRRLFPLIELGARHGFEMRQYRGGDDALVYLVHGRGHPGDLYRKLLNKKTPNVVIFDEANDLSSIFEVGLGKKIVRALPHLLKGRRHPGDILAWFARHCDAVAQGSLAQNKSIAAYVKSAFAVVDSIPAAEFDGSARLHRDNDCPVLLWDGTVEGFYQLELIEPALAELAKKVNFKLLVFTDRLWRRPRCEDVDITDRLSKFRCKTEFIEWRMNKLREITLSADIAIAPIDLSRRFNRVKPANKMISYWSYGLPVVVSATEAYKEVGVSGCDVFIAETISDWTVYLEKLILDSKLRKTIGRSGYAKAWANFDVNIFADRYFSEIRALLEAKGLI